MLQAKGKGDTKFVAPEPETPALNTVQDGVKEKTNLVTEPLRTTVTDFERTPKTQLMPLIEGSSWTTDEFFRSLKGKNDPKVLFDPKIENPSQQFDKIKHLELRVTTALDRDQNDENKTYSMTGAATIPWSVPVNEGDIFTATLGDGRQGLYTVLTSRRPSNNKVSTYEITYGMLYEVTPAHRAVLDKCTVREYYYVKERAWTGGDVILSPKEYRGYLALNELIDAVENTYVRRFYSSDLQTLLYPDLTFGAAYDAFLAQFVKSIGLRMVGKDIRIYPHYPKNIKDVETFWTCLLQQDPLFLAETNRDNQPFSTRGFRTLQSTNSVGWSKVFVTRYFVEDTGSMKYMGEWPKFKPFTTEDIQLDGSQEIYPAFLPITYQPYVLSQAFYDGGYASALEYGLSCYLNRKPLSSELAAKLGELVHKLPRDSQFYYVPLVYVLLKYAR